MHRILQSLLAVGAAALAIVSPATAGGILPDRDNRILIGGQFAEQTPGFLLIFSAKPLRDARGQPLTRMASADVGRFVNNREQLLIKVHGKPPSRPNLWEFSFGTLRDADMPWNNGREFGWKDWENYSPDIWDNLCLLAMPQAGTPNRKRAPAVISAVAILKGGKVLYDSRVHSSYPNKQRIDTSFKAFDLAPQRDVYPLLDLASRMERFRRDYYELGDNPILQLAYADLGQTEKRKYANRGTNWCSEFSSYIFRENGFMTPDPNRGDVHWKNMRTFFEQNGEVHSLHEVSRWPNEKKRAKIKPGSFVSILIGESTHSIIFTTWVVEPGKPITKYVGVSGNNRGMVWPHAPLKLPTSEDLKGMSAEKLRDYEQKAYFGVFRDPK